MENCRDGALTRYSNLATDVCVVPGTVRALCDLAQSYVQANSCFGGDVQLNMEPRLHAAFLCDDSTVERSGNSKKLAGGGLVVIVPILNVDL